MSSDYPQPDKSPSQQSPGNGPGTYQGAALAHPETALRRHRISGAVVTTATKLLPLLALLDAIQPAVDQESVFHARRKKMKLHLAEAYAELQAERPRRHALTHAFRTLAELVLEETRDIGRDELKQAAREVVLATLQNAPALINIAHQARLLA
ncbi:MAG: hypothetical protein JWR44_1695 [Hymenobacter sp.]|nr:hypothetical protein [Hymenobacter sp.]